MNVRITPRGEPARTDLYGGVDIILCDTDRGRLKLVSRKRMWEPIAVLLTRDISEIALDEDPGDWW